MNNATLAAATSLRTTSIPASAGRGISVDVLSTVIRVSVLLLLGIIIGVLRCVERKRLTRKEQSSTGGIYAYLQGFDVNANATTKPGLTLTTFEDKIRQFAALFDGIEKKFTETALSMFNVIGNHIRKVSLEVVN